MQLTASICCVTDASRTAPPRLSTRVAHQPPNVAWSPLELHSDEDTHRCLSILQNIMYFTVFEVAHIWLTNGWLMLTDADRHTKSSSTTAKN